MHAIGIDIGGTKIAGALVDELGSIVREDRVPTDASRPEEIENAVVAMIERLSDGPEEIAGAGVAAAGFIDAAQSIVYYAPNINWRHEPFREKLEKRIDLPVIIENDANAAGWAEFRFGAGRLVSDMVILTIGTGVGGAIVSNDRLFRGGFGAGAEIGHMRVVPGRPALRLRRARVHRAVRLRSRAAAYGQRAGRRRRHRPGARRRPQPQAAR